MKAFTVCSFPLSLGCCIFLSNFLLSAFLQCLQAKTDTRAAMETVRYILFGCNMFPVEGCEFAKKPAQSTYP